MICGKSAVYNHCRRELLCFSLIQTGYLGVVQLGQSGTSVGQQEVPAQDGHLIPKLHVLQRAVGVRPPLQIHDPTMHQERRVDQLGDFCQVPLAVTHRTNTKNTFKKNHTFFFVFCQQLLREAFQRADS